MRCANRRRAGARAFDFVPAVGHAEARECAEKFGETMIDTLSGLFRSGIEFTPRAPRLRVRLIFGS